MLIRIVAGLLLCAFLGMPLLAGSSSQHWGQANHVASRTDQVKSWVGSMVRTVDNSISTVRLQPSPASTMVASTPYPAPTRTR